jgi:hypothetical protein
MFVTHEVHILVIVIIITGLCFFYVTTSLLKSYASTVWDLATPKNISYLWGFGRFLGIIIVVQVVSGILLAFYYVRGALA